ncbi:MAG: adenylate/guanylate cyclase domain-containing protein [Syntrophobacteraceae bacterium]|nr:adenylate/guanylate cyclase domain-containing protein [Syntrophobacteraceae bacterium]
MYRNHRAIAIAVLLLGISGLLLDFTPWGFALEQDYGLSILFHLRGALPAPPDAVIVSLDQDSSKDLDLPFNLSRWPRRVYADLIENLVRGGAAVIVFDVFFSGSTSENDDLCLAEAIKKAGNVVLCEYLRHKSIPFPSGSSAKGSIYLETAERPVEKLADAATATAPFPLPKVPMSVSQYWLFKTESGCRPTLPLVAFQLFSPDTYRDFVRLLASVDAPRAPIPPRNGEKIIAEKDMGRLTGVIRTSFEDNPAIADAMLAKLNGPKPFTTDPARTGLLRAMIHAYTGPDSNFLNFYGPLTTLRTIPLSRILKGRRGLQNGPDVRGKAVFIGATGLVPSDQRDTCHTVFTNSEGTDLSGVEIAATAFENLVQDIPIRPVVPAIYLSIIILCGLIPGVISFVFRPAVAAVGIVCFGLLYMSIAQILFNRAQIWLPLIVPVAVQAPLAFWAGSLRHHAGTKKEGKYLRKAFGFFLPDQVISQLLVDMKTAKGLPTGRQSVYGTILASDAASYTSLAEAMSPEELNKFMNRYYETILGPVKAHSGAVSDIIGDSALAVWAGAASDPAFRRQACCAAIEIARAVDDFNNNSGPHKLHTRVGVHCGQLVLGHLGGSGHYEYRPVGDVVNTAARIEGLNKHLGTKILVSGEILEGVHDFLTRDLGRFIFAGKVKPVRVFELIGHLEEADEKQRDLIGIFSEALGALQNRSWEKSAKLFKDFLRIEGNDSPSLYYLKKCEIYRQNPPDESWDGVIRLNEK